MPFVSSRRAGGMKVHALGASFFALAAGCVLPSYSIGTGGDGAGETATEGAGASAGAGGTGAASGTTTAATGGTAGTNGAGGTTDTTGTLTTSTSTTTTGTQPPCAEGFECAPNIPAGWSPVRQAELAYGVADVSPCPAGGDLTTYFKAPVLPDCTSCFCPWLGAKCTEPELSCYYGNNVCSGGASLIFTPPSSTCVEAAGIPQNMTQTASCRITSPAQVLNAGTCTGYNPLPTPPEEWQTEVRLCSVATSPGAGDCSGLCVAQGEGLFNGPLCIQKAGDLSCPAGWSPANKVYSSAEDSRACSACACGSPTTTCGTGVYNVFPGPECAGGGAVTVNTACAGVGAALGQPGRSIKPPQISASSSSTCTGGFASGQVVPLDPSTICCAP